MTSLTQGLATTAKTVTHIGRPFVLKQPPSIASRTAIARAHARLWWAARGERPERDGTTRRTHLLGLEVSFFRWNALHHLFDEIFLDSCYAFTATSSTPTIIDAGANIGMATLWFSKAYPDARIVAIEPDPSAFELLERNGRDNGLRDFEPVWAALAPEDGTIDLMVDPWYPGGLQTSLDPKRAPRGSAVSVPARRLSGFVTGPVDLLKMDIEGAELGVLRETAASGALAQVRALALEYHHHIDPTVDELGQLLTLLQDAGFTYRVHAAQTTPRIDEPSVAGFQDIMILARRRSPGEPA